jgi:hypothetical protein
MNCLELLESPIQSTKFSINISIVKKTGEEKPFSINNWSKCNWNKLFLFKQNYFIIKIQTFNVFLN